MSSPAEIMLLHSIVRCQEMLKERTKSYDEAFNAWTKQMQPYVWPHLFTTWNEEHVRQSTHCEEIIDYRKKIDYTVELWLNPKYDTKTNMRAIAVLQKRLDDLNQANAAQLRAKQQMDACRAHLQQLRSDARLEGVGLLNASYF